MFSQKYIRNSLWKFVNRSYGVTNEYYQEKKRVKKDEYVPGIYVKRRKGV